ncbi:chemotaxis response regulator protein-glutamate methylesterase [Phormidesmis sp. 146-35]
MRIAIVNDTVIAIEALRRVLLKAPHQIAWIAKTGIEAVAQCAKDRPDLILMDLIMPEMDGVEATRQIMQRSPCAILIVTANVQQSSAKVFEAMGQGALDAVNTPILGSQEPPEAAQTLLHKIATIEKLIDKSDFAPISSQVRSTSALIAIGASTGGPKALATILSRLPINLAAAIVIVQHVDAQFAVGLIDWLSHETPLPVKKAMVGDRPERGTILVACTNDHLCLQSNGTLTYTQSPVEYPYRPSIDVFFNSVARYWTTKGTAILLTGMGRDGATGLSALRQRGWYTIAQNKESCVVYGMPKAAIELKAAVDVLTPEAIATTLSRSYSR